MRLRKLTMSCIGPYAGTAAVDFTSLGEVFLLCGKSGPGARPGRTHPRDGGAPWKRPGRGPGAGVCSASQRLREMSDSRYGMRVTEGRISGRGRGDIPRFDLHRRRIRLARRRDARPRDDGA
jgi:hypothetical protein